jgi:hypothetical protein
MRTKERRNNRRRGRHHLGDLSIDGRIILTQILKK